MKKDKNADHLAIIDNYKFCDKHTDKHGNSMTDPAQRAESMKMVVHPKVMIESLNLNLEVSKSQKCCILICVFLSSRFLVQSHNLVPLKNIRIHQLMNCGLPMSRLRTTPKGGTMT